MRQKTVYFLPAALYYGLIFFLSSRPNVRLPVVFPLIDKILHLILFTGFGLVLAYGLMKIVRRGNGLAAALALGAILAVLDEIHQMFVPGRSAEILDALVDILGVAAGWGIARMIARNRRGRKLFAPVGPK